MSKNKQPLSDEIVKSLAEELDITEDEIRDLLKSESEETEESDDEKEEEEEDSEEKEEEKAEKSEESDISKMSDDDLRKSVADLMQEMTKRQKPAEHKDNDINKAIENGLMSFRDDIVKSFEDRIESLTNRLDNISSTIDAIGQTSKGLKGLRFDYIQKSGDMDPVEKDGKTYISSRDRDSISEAMLDVISKSEDEDIKRNTSADLINYQGSNELSERAVKTLNRNGYFFKEQMK